MCRLRRGTGCAGEHCPTGHHLCGQQLPTPKLRSGRWLCIATAMGRRSYYRHLQFPISAPAGPTSRTPVNNLSRVIIVVTTLGLCAGGLIVNARNASPIATAGSDSFNSTRFLSSFEFASSDLYKFSFYQLEQIVRADAAARFPNAR